MKFIDLFAGLGGFHIALSRLGHTCVFASEKKKPLADVYERNFSIQVNQDITKIIPAEVPSHEILCAGFPCQPFSKAGDREGLEDRSNGYLFNNILKILDYHRPEYIILENVKNLETHDSGQTWAYIKKELTSLGYSIDARSLSPHEFGIPQHRERFFIVGCSSRSLKGFRWPEKSSISYQLTDYLDDSVGCEFDLEEEKKQVIDIWQRFLECLPSRVKLPSWPIWAMEFGATYPYQDSTPHSASRYEMLSAKGSFGKPLNELSTADRVIFFTFVCQNESEQISTMEAKLYPAEPPFYKDNKKYIEDIVQEIRTLPIASYQKFEWNLQGEERNIYKHLVQFRGSGVRVKRANYFPSLVTVRTQTPVLGWKLRYLTPNEGARIQSLSEIQLPDKLPTSYAALGNAVNATIVYKVASNLIIK